MKIEEAIAIAKAEIGTKENPPNSNNVKYNTWYYGHEVSGSAYPWCCVFMEWVFRNTNLLTKTASCTTLYNWFKSKGKTHSDPRVGDLVFFNFDKNPKAGQCKHIGIVVEVIDSKNIKSIEGNTSSGNKGSQDNGGCVALRSRKSSQIVGYATPDYSDKAPVPTTNHPTLKQGDKGSEVLYLHEILHGLKYGVSTSNDTYDALTKQCIMHVQASHYLKVDGICGQDTWKALGV